MESDNFTNDHSSNNSKIRDIASNNRITITATILSSPSLRHVTMFVLILLSVALGYTVYILRDWLWLLVPSLIGLALVMLLWFSTSHLVRHTARTTAVISHSRAQEHRNSILAMNEHTAILRNGQTGELKAISITQKTEHHHYGGTNVTPVENIIDESAIMTWDVMQVPHE